MIIQKTLLKVIRARYRHFSKNHMEVVLGDINAKLGRDYIFKPTTGNDSFHQDSNDNGVRVITCASSKT